MADILTDLFARWTFEETEGNIAIDEINGKELIYNSQFNRTFASPALELQVQFKPLKEFISVVRFQAPMNMQ